MFHSVQLNFLFLFSIVFLFPACFVNGQEIESAEFRSSSDVNVLYHEKSPSLLVDLYSVHHEFSGKLKSGSSSFSFYWETDHELYRYKTAKNKLDLKIGTGQNNFSFLWKFTHSDLFIEPGISVSLSDFGTRFGFGLTLGWKPDNGNEIQASYFKREKSFYHEWNIEDSHPQFNQWSDINDLKVSGTYSPFGELSLKSEIRKQFYSVGSVSEPFSDSSKYDNLSYSAEIIFRPNNRMNSWVKFSDFSGSGDPDFRFQKFSFSSFNNGKTTDRQFSAGVLYDTQKSWEVGTEFNYRKLEISSSGLLQSFPFTAGVISILGDYYFFSLDGKISSYNLDVAGIYYYEEQKSLTLKTGYQLVEPDLFLQTWEPLFFTVGRKNEKTKQLDFTRLHIIPLTVQWKFKIKSYSVDLMVNQLIPVYAEKKSKSSSPGNNSSGSSSSSSGTQPEKFVWGGTNLKISIGYEI